jgi:hypothetical protein
VNAVRKTASVAPSTVTRLSKGEVGKVSGNRKRRAPRVLAVLDEQAVKVDPRIMAALREQGTDFHYVEVVSPTEVIVHNQRVR